MESDETRDKMVSIYLKLENMTFEFKELMTARAFALAIAGWLGSFIYRCAPNPIRGKAEVFDYIEKAIQVKKNEEKKNKKKRANDEKR